MPTSATRHQSRMFTRGYSSKRVFDRIGRGRCGITMQHVVRQVTHLVGVPLARPADEVEEPGDDSRGEAPQDDVALGPDQEARAEPAGRVADVDAVGGIDQVGDRDVVDGVHLVGADHAHVAALAPVAQDRCHGEVGRRQPQLGQLAEHLDLGRIEPDLLLRLAQRRLDRALAGVDRAAGEGHLPGVRTHVVRALGEQQLAAPVPVEVGEQDQYGAAAGVTVLGRHEARQLVDGDRTGGLRDRRRASRGSLTGPPRDASRPWPPAGRASR